MPAREPALVATDTHLVVSHRTVRRVLTVVAVLAVAAAAGAISSVAAVLPGMFWVLAALMVTTAAGTVVTCGVMLARARSAR